MRVLSGIWRRIGKARETAALSRRPRDWPALAVLGLARYTDFSHADPLSRACRRLFPTLAVRTDRMNHLAVLIAPADTTHFPIFQEVVVEDVYDLTAVPFDPDLIVDCGGHIGLFTARAAGRYPGIPVVAFEPMPANADLLAAMAARNGLAGVDLRRAAVSDHDGTARFHQRMSYGGSLADDVGGVAATYDVPVVDLVAFVRGRAPRALLLKVDVEGEEERLLPALIPHLPPRSAVFFETHSAARGWDLIAGAFVAAGFDVRLIRTRDPWRDGIAVREPAAPPPLVPAATPGPGAA